MEKNRKFHRVQNHQPLNLRRKGIFISYCHQDGKAFKEFLAEELRPLRGEGAEILEDGLMQAGDNWKHQVLDYLSRARVAILLVTRSVVYSEAIREFEINEIRSRAEAGELVFLWLHVQKSDYGKLNIQDIIAPHDVREPLENDRQRQLEAAKEVFRLTKNILRGRQVIVAGSMPKSQVSEEFKKDCKNLGTSLIRNDFSLVCGSWRPEKADCYAYNGAVFQAKNEGLSGDDGVITCIGTDIGFKNQLHPDKDYIGYPTTLKTSLESRVRQVEQADIVVLIGGNTGSRDIIFEAAWQRKLVIPTGKYNGAGRDMYKALSRRLIRSISDMNPEQLGRGDAKDMLLTYVNELKVHFNVENVITLVKVFCSPSRPRAAGCQAHSIQTTLS